MFARVTKYVVAVSFAVATCFSGFSDDPPSSDVRSINCRASEPYQDDTGVWLVDIICDGEFSSRGSYVLQDIGGGCTNCTAMSPAQCEEYKLNVITSIEPIIASSQQIQADANMVLANVQSASEAIYHIVQEGDQFVDYPYDKMTSLIPGSSTTDRSSYIQSLPGADYLSPNRETPNANYLRQQYGGLGAIHNYYNDGVKPFLDQAQSSLMSTVSDANRIITGAMTVEGDLSAVKNYVSSIPCAACPGGGTGGGSGGSSSACPCSEVLEHIKNLVQEKRDILKDWNDNQLPELKKRLDKWESIIKVIQDAVAPIGTNFVAAVNYKTLDGVSFQMKELDQLLHRQPDQFDYREFEKLSWYSRVEYLLMSIAGVFSVTNRDDSLTQSTIDDVYDDVANQKSSIESQVGSVSSQFSQLSSSFRGLFSSLKSSAASHDGSGMVSLFPSWFGGRGLVMTIPPSVISSARVVTSLLWTVIFITIFYNFVLYGWIAFAHFMQFWIRQTTGFLK